MSNNVLYLSDNQWDNRIKTIATKRLKKFRRALTATSMGRYFNVAIIEFREGIVVVDESEYKRLRKLFMEHSDEQLREMGEIGGTIK